MEHLRENQNVHPVVEPSEEEEEDKKYYTTKELSLITRKIRGMCLRGRYEPALRFCTRHLKASKHPVFFLERSAIYLNLGKKRRALRDAKDAHKLLPESGEAYFALAKAQFKMKNYRKCRITIAEGLEKDPHSLPLRQLRRVAFNESVELTEEQIVELREAFYLFDDDLNGFIEPSELLAIMKDLGTDDITEKEVYRVLSHFDLNADHNVEFSEFVTMMADELRGMNMEKELRMAFAFFDKDRSGTVSVSELRTGLRKLGEGQIAHNVDLMFRDLKLDREITFEDFVKAMISNKYNC